jgi:4-nitrophenyl phosphatase
MTAERLDAVKGFVFDLDGTLALGDRRNHGLRPLRGGLEVTRYLTEREVPYAIFTNGTARTPAAYASMLRDLGFDVPADRVLTPATSAVDVLLRRGHHRVMVLGTEGLTEPLRAAGIDVVPPRRGERADAVLAGWYTEFGMAALEAACAAVWDGAAVYSASQSIFFATAEGRSIGTSRAICGMIRDLTGARIRVVGKPSLDALHSAARRLGVRARDLAVVGDDPDLEVPMAHRGRACAIAVATGLSGPGAYDHLPVSRRPHLSLAGVHELADLLAGRDAAKGVPPSTDRHRRRSDGLDHSRG